MKRLILAAIAILGMAAPALADTTIIHRTLQWDGRRWVEISRWVERIPSTPAPPVQAPPPVVTQAPAYTQPPVYASPPMYYRQPARPCETGT